MTHSVYAGMGTKMAAWILSPLETQRIRRKAFEFRKNCHDGEAMSSTAGFQLCTRGRWNPGPLSRYAIQLSAVLVQYSLLTFDDTCFLLLCNSSATETLNCHVDRSERPLFMTIPEQKLFPWSISLQRGHASHIMVPECVALWPSCQYIKARTVVKYHPCCTQVILRETPLRTIFLATPCSTTEHNKPR